MHYDSMLAASPRQAPEKTTDGREL